MMISRALFICNLGAGHCTLPSRSWSCGVSWYSGRAILALFAGLPELGDAVRLEAMSRRGIEGMNVWQTA